MWEHQIVICVTIDNSFVLCSCPFCKLQLRTVCDLSATMYVCNIRMYCMYRAHSRVYTLWCGLVGSIMEVPKIKGREAGLSMKAIEIKANQGVLLTSLNDGQDYTKCPLSLLIQPPQCTLAMSLMCEDMKIERKLLLGHFIRDLSGSC